jgi:ribonuclease HI
MHASTPHYLLFSEASGAPRSVGRWRFVLQSIGGDAHVSAEDAEPGARSSRLELLAVVRGLEALDGPSRITLLTNSRYVKRGICRGLAHWRERSWRWERFGHLVPIRDYDLWQRVDRAMGFHQVECCEWNGVAATPIGDAAPIAALADQAASPALLIVPRCSSKRWPPRRTAFWPLAEAFGRLRRGLTAGLAAMRQPAFTRAT